MGDTSPFLSAWGARNQPASRKRRGPANPTGELPVANDGWSTCPECRRTWLVTAADDVCIPPCGCHGTDWGQGNRWRLCASCCEKHSAECSEPVEQFSDVMPVWASGTPHTFGKGLDS